MNCAADIDCNAMQSKPELPQSEKLKESEKTWKGKIWKCKGSRSKEPNPCSKHGKEPQHGCFECIIWVEATDERNMAQAIRMSLDSVAKKGWLMQAD